MKKKFFRAAVLAAMMVLLAQSLAACTFEKNNSDSPFYVYYLEPGKNELIPVKAEIDWNNSMNVTISSIWNQMQEVPEGAAYVSPVPLGMTMNSYSLEEHDLVLNFSSEYNTISSVSELLLRAAIVKTFTQINEVSTVEIRVESQTLTDSDGNPIGPQKSSDFVDVLGRGLNAYAEAEVTLYFADESGKALVMTTRSLTYNTSSPLEQYVVQALIQGPDADSDLKAVFPTDTKLISVSTKNGICHVNLNDAILTEDLYVEPAVLIYSIVDTLTEIGSIGSVQISVNGSSSLAFKNEISLENPISRDMTYVKDTLTEPEK